MPKTSRASEFRHKYGVLGAGALRRSLIGRVPPEMIGPVYGSSFRVASRLANTLRGGFAARSMEAMRDVAVLLVHAPAGQMHALVSQIGVAPINWRGKAVVFCDDRPPEEIRQRIAATGAAVVVLRSFGVSGRVIVEGERARRRGSASGLAVAHALARVMRLRPLNIAPEDATLFDAALTLGSGASTGLIDIAASFMRQAGVRDSEAKRLAAAVFDQTARDYAHAGRQSWIWYARKPDGTRLAAQLESIPDSLRPLLNQLLLTSFERFGKHQEIAAQLRG